MPIIFDSSCMMFCNLVRGWFSGAGSSPREVYFSKLMNSMSYDSGSVARPWLDCENANSMFELVVWCNG